MANNMKREKIFEKYTLNNGVEIKNRMVVTPMTLFVANQDGTFSEKDFNFMKKRGENMGMFIVEATLVCKGGKAFNGQPEAIGEEHILSLRKVSEMLKAQGTKAILQIHHGGRLAIRELNNNDIVAPSYDDETGAREITVKEIEDVIKAFGSATELAIKAGFDGVEIHGANRYLIQQFYSEKTNSRNDEWGGSIQKRMKFPLAVIDSVVEAKKKCNADKFIIGYRFSPEEPDEKGITMAETFMLIDSLKEKPLQYLHVSLPDFYIKAFRGADTGMEAIKLIHERIDGKLPLIGVGGLYTGEEIEKALKTGWAEFIALGKTVIVNPNIGTLIAENREEEIVTELDPEREDRYDLGDFLWERAKQGGSSLLPPLKKK